MTQRIAIITLEAGLKMQLAEKASKIRDLNVEIYEPHEVTEVLDQIGLVFYDEYFQ